VVVPELFWADSVHPSMRVSFVVVDGATLTTSVSSAPLAVAASEAALKAGGHGQKISLKQNLRLYGKHSADQ
jgi:hypothetical protein